MRAPTRGALRNHLNSARFVLWTASPIAKPRVLSRSWHPSASLDAFECDHCGNNLSTDVDVLHMPPGGCPGTSVFGFPRYRALGRSSIFVTAFWLRLRIQFVHAFHALIPQGTREGTHKIYNLPTVFIGFHVLSLAWTAVFLHSRSHCSILNHHPRQKKRLRRILRPGSQRPKN